MSTQGTSFPTLEQEFLQLALLEPQEALAMAPSMAQEMATMAQEMATMAQDMATMGMEADYLDQDMAASAIQAMVMAITDTHIPTTTDTVDMAPLIPPATMATMVIIQATMDMALLILLATMVTQAIPLASMAIQDTTTIQVTAMEHQPTDL